MNIRSAVRQLVRKSYEEEAEPLKADILDCALGRNSFGTSERVVEFAEQRNSDYVGNRLGKLRQELCQG